MMERLRRWWRGLALRERKVVALAAAVVIGALLYAVAIEPAWKTRARLSAQLPQLREQAARLEAMGEEVRQLRERGSGVETAGSLRAAAEKSSARAGLAVKVRQEGERTLVASAESVGAQAWFAWLEGFARESRVRVAHVRAVRAKAPGNLDAEATFELPER
jgi:general secretion pathway protein M